MEKSNKLMDSLNIDPKKEVERIENFITDEVKRLGKEGVVIGLSGGLDSSVCAFLSKNSLGKKRILALILPERDSELKNIEDARMIAKKIALPTKEIDLTPFLEEIGVYKLFSQRISQNREFVEKLIKKLEKIFNQPSLFAFGFPIFFGQEKSLKNILSRKIFLSYAKKIAALATAKTRLRMLFLYYFAAFKNYLVLGTTDKSEWSIGFYEGDAISHLQPLKHLFKTQIRKLATYLSLPKQIIEKSSSGDLFARGIPNELLIGLSYEILDSILAGLEQGYSLKEIENLTKANQKQIQAISRLVKIDKIRKSLPLSLI